MYYAEFSPYGADTISNGDVLAAFETREERAEWCERINARILWPEKAEWHEVTTREVAHAYNMKHWRTDYEHELSGERTCKGKPVFYIHRRPVY